MKIRPVVLLCVAALIPQLALSETPPSSQQRGAVQAVVDFCSRVDPKDEKRFEDQAKVLLRNLKEDHSEVAQRSAEYQQAYRTIESVLNEFPLPDAVRACAASI